MIQTNPKISIILFSIVVSFFITLVNYFVLDRERMRELKHKQKHLQEQMKIHKDNHEKIAELNNEMMQHAMETMKHSFKPMLITFIPVIIFFGWIRGIFVETAIAKSWIWYYIGFSMVSGITFRKLFKLD